MLEGDKVNLDKVACAREVLDEVIIHLEKGEGKVDDFRYYTKALTPEEIAKIANIQQVDSSLDKEAADAQRELEGEGVQK